MAFAEFAENHRFQIPAKAHWKAVRSAGSNVGAAIQSATRAIEKANPEKLYGIFGDAQWTNKDRLSDDTLKGSGRALLGADLVYRQPARRRTRHRLRVPD